VGGLTALPIRARFILIGTVALAMLAVAYVVAPSVYARLTPEEWFGLAFLLLLHFLADTNLIPWHFPNTTISITVSTGIDIALVLLFGPAVALPFVALTVLLAEAYVRRPPVKLAYNAAMAVLSAAAACLAFATFGTPGLSPLANGWQVLAWLLAAGAHVLANGTLLALMIGAVNGAPFARLWRDLILGGEMQQWTQPPLGALIAILYLHSPWALVLAILPLLAIYVSYRRFLELNRQARTVIETLTDTLERRDPITARHSRRVTEYARLLLGALGAVPLTDAETILAAARIHDLGKVAVRDACLLKPGPLTPEERHEMQQHPVIGAQLLKPLSIYQEMLEIVRHHHEYWDGRGYPDGLTGEQIPFGARLLAVADAFDAMTNDRPYRRAMTVDQALAEIAAGRGTQFDPVIVDAFVAALRDQASARPPVQHDATSGA
jgi:HD-GYP domain-containing protein (c-di-GMP phosphodiesterase class II)